MTEHTGTEAAMTVTVDGAELYRAFCDGASAEELNEQISQSAAAQAEQETAAEREPAAEPAPAPEPEPQAAADGGNETGKTDEPDETPEFFKTREAFQRQFDYEWNKRYARQMRELEQTRAQLDAMRGEAAAVLGVGADQALEALRARRIAAEAKQRGMDPAQYAQAERLRTENEALRQTLAAREREQRAGDLAASLREQAKKLAAQEAGFDLDQAMADPEFRATVFANLRVNPRQALERTVRALRAADAPAKQDRPRPRRIAEGAARDASSGEVKPADLRRLSSKQILELQERILNGESVTLS